MKTSLPRSRAFTLVEVVIAVGVVSFCLVALMGLFSVGLTQSSNSSQTVRAAHVMTRLLALRTSQPVAVNAADGSALALPPLDKPADSVAALTPVYLGPNGEKLAGATGAAFQLNFRVSIPTAGESNTAVGKISRGWAVISWPGPAPLNRSAGSYEITFCQTLP